MKLILKSRQPGRELDLRVESFPYAIGRDEPLFVGAARTSARWADAIATISRRHASVTQCGSQILIADLGSLNGTVLNGRPVGQSPVLLTSGDILSLGNELNFQIILESSDNTSTYTAAGITLSPRDPESSLRPLALHSFPCLISRNQGPFAAYCEAFPAQEGEISRSHAQLEQKAGGVVVRDLGSLNGTRLNGKLLCGKAESLRHGDTLAFSPFFDFLVHLPPSQSDSRRKATISPGDQATVATPTPGAIGGQGFASRAPTMLPARPPSPRKTQIHTPAEPDSNQARRENPTDSMDTHIMLGPSKGAPSPPARGASGKARRQTGPPPEESRGGARRGKPTEFNNTHGAPQAVGEGASLSARSGEVPSKAKEPLRPLAFASAAKEKASTPPPAPQPGTEVTESLHPPLPPVPSPPPPRDAGASREEPAGNEAKKTLCQAQAEEPGKARLSKDKAGPGRAATTSKSYQEALINLLRFGLKETGGDVSELSRRAGIARSLLSRLIMELDPEDSADK